MELREVLGLKHSLFFQTFPNAVSTLQEVSPKHVPDTNLCWWNFIQVPETTNNLKKENFPRIRRFFSADV